MTLPTRSIPQQAPTPRARWRPTVRTRTGIRRLDKESIFIGAAAVCMVDIGWGSGLIFAALVWCVAGWSTRRRAAHERTQAIRRDLPDIVELLRVAVASGSGPRQALITTGRVIDDLASFGSESSEVRAHFVLLGRLLETGRSLQAAFDAVAPSSDLFGRLSLLMTRSEQHGQQLSEGLERFANELNDSRLLDLDARAQRATVSLLFPLVLCILPSFLLLVVVPVLIASFDGLGTGLLSR